MNRIPINNSFLSYIYFDCALSAKYTSNLCYFFTIHNNIYCFYLLKLSKIVGKIWKRLNFNIMNHNSTKWLKHCYARLEVFIFKLKKHVCIQHKQNKCQCLGKLGLDHDLTADLRLVDVFIRAVKYSWLFENVMFPGAILLKSIETP